MELAALTTLNDAFRYLLFQHHAALKSVTKGFPKLSSMVHHDKLACALESYLDHSLDGLRQLEHLFAALEVRPELVEDSMAKSLTDDAVAIAESEAVGEVIDLLLATTILRLQHYQISTLGVLQSMAEQLDQGAAARVIRQAMAGEIEAEEAIAGLVEGVLTSDAMTTR